MKIRTIRTAAAIAGLTGLVLTAGGCAANPSDGVTTLDFFQFKGEALEDFAEIIDEFEAENPDIRVVQNQVADSETLIRTLLVKDRTPDVITLNANGNFGKLAEAGVFYDFSDEPVLQTINPGVQDILADLGTYEGEVNSLGYVNNANGIIYNRAIFVEQGLEVPETWDELIALCQTLQERGVTPFGHRSRRMDRDAVVERHRRVLRAGRLLRQDAGGGRERRPGCSGVVRAGLPRGHGASGAAVRVEEGTAGPRTTTARRCSRGAVPR